MNKLRGVYSAVIVIQLIAILLLATFIGTRVQASGPEDDGRINQLPWVNSYGAIAVYCINAANKPSDNFTGGAIVFLNSAGIEIFRAPERIINPRRILANRFRRQFFIHRQGLYTLWALPDGFFQITTPPDVEGKTSLAVWKDCAGPRVASVAPSPIPTVTPLLLQ